jgi:O-antigen/teichoic acid export membrane protein
MCSDYIRILSPLVPIMYCDTVTDGLLKGLDQQNASMKYNIIDSAICVFLVYILIPKYSTSGYIFILFLSEILNFTLSISRLIRTAELKINLNNDVIKPLIASLIACGFIKIISDPVESIKTGVLLLHIVIFSSIYLFCLYALKSISKEEIKTYKSYIKPKVALD